MTWPGTRRSSCCVTRSPWPALRCACSLAWRQGRRQDQPAGCQPASLAALSARSRPRRADAGPRSREGERAAARAAGRAQRRHALRDSRRGLCGGDKTHVTVSRASSGYRGQQYGARRRQCGGEYAGRSRAAAALALLYWHRSNYASWATRPAPSGARVSSVLSIVPGPALADPSALVRAVLVGDAHPAMACFGLGGRQP
jgi:hypothetical protein